MITGVPAGGIGTSGLTGWLTQATNSTDCTIAATNKRIAFPDGVVTMLHGCALSFSDFRRGCVD
jgi:hypothetical protein